MKTNLVPKFIEGEKVLCYHGPLLYEAKCKKSEVRDKVMQYLIHYNGWNKHWDEWVTEKRVLKHNPANLLMQDELLRNQKDKKHTKAKSSKVNNKDKQKEAAKRTADVVPASPAESRRKRVRVDSEATEDNEEESEAEEKFLEIIIKIPDSLKVILADDADNITKKNMLHKLKAVTSVKDILNQFTEHFCSDCNSKSNLKEFGLGITSYFDYALSSRLLYAQEKDQHARFIKENPTNTKAEIYGGIHLLRLFTILGQLLSVSSFEKEHVEKLLEYITQFLSFMEDKSKDFFSPDDYELLS